MDRLQRFLAPVVLFSTAGYVGWINAGAERRMVFPFLDRLSTDPHVQGHLTLALLLALGSLALVLAMRTPQT